MIGDNKIIELQAENRYLHQRIEVYKAENCELTNQLQQCKESVAMKDKVIENRMRIVYLLYEYYGIPQWPGDFNEPKGGPGKEGKV